MKGKTLNIDRINELIDAGYVMKNKHPEADLWIYNYTQFAQYERYWTEETLQCRGLILDAQGHIVSRPIDKFFNIEEVGFSNLPELPFEVYDKMDGSLGILYWLNGKAQIATRGSFNSVQSNFANDLLHSKYKDSISKLDPSKTYVFEIIYPENRIVVDYKEKEELVLLAIIDTITGEEEKLTEIGFPIVKKYSDFTDLSDLKKLDWENKEGFVVRFSNNFRIKIKFENYIETHRVVTQLSSIMIWESLKKNESIIPFLDEIPDEFYAWVKKVELQLTTAFSKIEEEAKQEYKECSTVRETAEYYKTCKHTPILFAMFNKKDYKNIIWKMVRPQFEKAFSNQ